MTVKISGEAFIGTRAALDTRKVELVSLRVGFSESGFVFPERIEEKI